MSAVETELPKTQEQKTKAAQLAVDAVNKEFGKNSLQKVVSKDKAERIPSVPTGLVTLDEDLLGTGGIPRGRIIEIFGPESSGKTTIALQVIGEAQKIGDLCAFIDAEHALDPAWAIKNGVSVEDLFINQPSSGEEALEITEALVRSGAFGVIVVDSVAALVPRAELEGEMGDSHMGLQARLMSQACRKLVGVVNKTNTIVIFINQIREKIGVMFGSPETTTGGRALKFYASVRIDIRRIGQVKKGDEITGSKVKIKIVKNKVAAPFRESEFDLMYGYGLDKVSDTIDYCVRLGLIDKAGAWYTLNSKRFQGKENLREHLVSSTTEYDALHAELVRKINE